MVIRSRHCCSPFSFFVLPAKIIFLLRAIHQFFRTDGSQRVNRLYRIHIHLPAENILNIHDIAVLAFQCLNQRIGFQCIGHHLRTHLTVHISRQVVPQGSKHNNDGSQKKDYRTSSQQHRKTVQFRHMNANHLFQCILINDGQLILKLNVPPECFTTFLFHT